MLAVLQGCSWLPRYAVLTDDKLAFTMMANSDEILDCIPLHEIDAVGRARLQCPSVVRA